MGWSCGQHNFMDGCKPLPGSFLCLCWKWLHVWAAPMPPRNQDWYIFPGTGGNSLCNSPCSIIWMTTITDSSFHRQSVFCHHIQLSQGIREFAQWASSEHGRNCALVWGGHSCSPHCGGQKTSKLNLLSCLLFDEYKWKFPSDHICTFEPPCELLPMRWRECFWMHWAGQELLVSQPTHQCHYWHWTNVCTFCKQMQLKNLPQVVMQLVLGTISNFACLMALPWIPPPTPWHNTLLSLQNSLRQGLSTWQVFVTSWRTSTQILTLIVPTLWSWQQSAVPVKWKSPLRLCHLETFLKVAQNSRSYNDLLFITILSCCFYACHWSGELIQKNSAKLPDWHKIIKWGSLTFEQGQAQYYLPYHKVDPFYCGTDILFTSQEITDPVSLLCEYTFLCDRHHGACAALFIQEDGHYPSQSWFDAKFFLILGHNYGGHSPCAGGATFFASLGLSKDVIQAIGRWSSRAWKIYIRDNPLVQAEQQLVTLQAHLTIHLIPPQLLTNISFTSTTPTHNINSIINLFTPCPESFGVHFGSLMFALSHNL